MKFALTTIVFATPDGRLRWRAFYLDKTVHLLTSSPCVCSKMKHDCEKRKCVSFNLAANRGKHKPPVKIFLKFLTAVVSITFGALATFVWFIHGGQIDV